MTDNGPGPDVLQIKKYPNRRFYDATRSCHVTLHNVHDLVLAGHDVCITDSRTNEDITNLVLAQILLEKDQPKLDIFPSSIFHMMIRSNRQVLRGYVDRYFAPMVGIMSSSQKQFEQFVRTASGGAFMSPVEWTNRMMEIFGQGSNSRGPGSTEPIPDPAWDEVEPDSALDTSGDAGRRGEHSSHSADASANPASIDELRAQAADLIRRIDQLNQPSDDEAT